MKTALTGTAFVILFATLLGRLGNLHWVTDYFALFHDWYLWIGLILLVLCGLLRNWRGIGLALLTILVNGWLIGPYFWGGGEPVSAEPNSSIRLMSYNIYTNNDDLAGVVAEVRQHNPDVVFLMEYSFDIQREIEAEFADYPYQLIEPSRFTMGLALFSRFPLENVQIHRRQATRIPIFQTDIIVDGQPVSFVGGHPWPPFPQWGNLHRRQMMDIVSVAANARHPLIVTGDFNASQWSSTVATMRNQANVQDAYLGRGLIKTWRNAPLSLTLDHILISDNIGIHNYTVGALGGSDHTPLIVDLAVR